MNIVYGIKNFKTFNEAGVNTTISPITILTGCNSSGKSSVTKSLMLLKTFFDEIKVDKANGNKIDLSKYKLDFYKGGNDLLGNFNSVLNENSTDGVITFSYKMRSLLLMEDVIVELQFIADENDMLNNGFLKSYSFKRAKDGTIIKSETISPTSKKKTMPYNAEAIIEDFKDFVCLESLINEFPSNYIFDDFEKDDSEKTMSALKDFHDTHDHGLLRDVFKYKRKKIVHALLSVKVAQTLHENGLFFYMPVLDLIKDFTKENFKGQIDLLFKGKEYKSSLLDTKVAEDFLASGSETFLDYFKKMEEMRINESYSDTVKTSFEWEYEMAGNMGHGEFVRFDGSGLSELSKEEKAEERKKLNLEMQNKIDELKNIPVNFGMLVEYLIKLDKALNNDYKNYYEVSEFPPGWNPSCCFYSLKALGEYESRIDDELLLPEFMDSLSYVSSTRASIERVYKLSGNDSFTTLLRNYFDVKRNKASEKSDSYEIDTFINKWIKEFGLGKSLRINREAQGIGVYLCIEKDNGQMRLLADEGYGITQLVSILLQIELSINHCEREFHGIPMDEHITFRNFDYGVNKQQTIIIEEPEIHLHPSYQSKLAEMMVEVYKKYNIHFIVETHSEYIIRKLQTLVAQKYILSDEISLNYVYGKDDYVSPSESRVRKIDIREDGSLTNSFGPGFFDEADNLSTNLMRIQIDGYEK